MVDITHYAFATYVFILVCIGMWLAGRILRTARKNKNDKTGYEKEQRLFTLYQNIEDMLSGLEEHAQEARTEAERSKEQIEKMLEEAKKIFADVQHKEEKKAKDSTQAKDVKPDIAAVPRASTVVHAAYKAGAAVRERKDDLPAAAGGNTAQEFEQLFEATADFGKKPAKGGVLSIESARYKTRDKVASLCAKGFEINEIAQQLGISVREAALAVKLRK